MQGPNFVRYPRVRNLEALQSRWWVNIYYGWHSLKENGPLDAIWFLIRQGYFWREVALLAIWTAATTLELIVKSVVLMTILPYTMRWLRLVRASRQLYAAHYREPTAEEAGKPHEGIGIEGYDL